MNPYHPNNDPQKLLGARRSYDRADAVANQGIINHAPFDTQVQTMLSPVNMPARQRHGEHQIQPAERQRRRDRRHRPERAP